MPVKPFPISYKYTCLFSVLMPSTSVWARLNAEEPVEIKITSTAVTVSKLKRLLKLHLATKLEHLSFENIRLRYPTGPRGCYLINNERLCFLTNHKGDAIAAGETKEDPIEIVVTTAMLSPVSPKST